MDMMKAFFSILQMAMFQKVLEKIFLFTPKANCTRPLSCSNLDGITRDAVIQICHELGIGIEERNITRDELYIAEEFFLAELRQK